MDYYLDEYNATIDEQCCLSNEIEIEKSNKNRDVYINRNLIFSDRYIEAIKSLGENKYCTRTIVDVSRTILEHHHGDKFEDLCFIDSSTNKSLSRMDYREREQEVLPTKAMKQMAINNPNIISIHNHPTDALPSYEDVKTCYLIGYKYGLVICHGGSIYQYKSLNEINRIIYESESNIFYKEEQILSEKYVNQQISEKEFKVEHNANFYKFALRALDAGIYIREVLWNERSQK